jgi:TatD DNase family protein
MLVDAHAHLDSAKFEGDRQAVLTRAWEAGLGAIVTIGVDLPSSQRAVALAEAYEGIYATVGMHPHHARKLNGEVLARFREMGRHEKVVAVGEIGLDFYRDLSPRDVQRRAFQAQLAWAAQLGKPVVIHDRDAHEGIMEVLAGWAERQQGSPLKDRLGVLHTFSGDLAMAEQAVALGFYISIAGPVTYHNARQLPEVVRVVPLDRLLVETDAPFLAPQPHRGQRNEPAYVRLVAERIAALRGVPPAEVAEATTANAQRLFGFKIRDRKHTDGGLS